MKLSSRRSPYLVAAGVLSILFGLTGAWSEPARTIKIVVPYPAGGTADILARILGEQISRTEGVTLLTENRPGASAIIGTEAVSRAAPDGSTLLITSTAFLIAPHLTKLNYDPLTSFEPICQLVSTPIVVIVNSGSPYGTLADWLNAARAKPVFRGAFRASHSKCSSALPTSTLRSYPMPAMLLPLTRCSAGM